MGLPGHCGLTLRACEELISALEESGGNWSMNMQ